ncbi:MAG: hypothetical protein RLZZ453_849 [Chlamydiota bacterium]|jgi:hypothetical protein
MSKVNSLLTERFKKAGTALSKMTSLVEQSSTGNLSSFSGVFKVNPLSDTEKEKLKNLLETYQEENQSVDDDLFFLATLTAEVKAINNQAILLHGERIKKAQELLKSYKEGAFSSWLIATYGNRQTPYNFLQYYELCTLLNEELKSKLDEMPRQAIYSLASREGEVKKKIEIISQYAQESKQALLKLIRETFPLKEKDKRAQNLSIVAAKSLSQLAILLSSSTFEPSEKEKKELLRLVGTLKRLIQEK